MMVQLHQYSIRIVGTRTGKNANKTQLAPPHLGLSCCGLQRCTGGTWGSCRVGVGRGRRRAGSGESTLVSSRAWPVR